MTRIAFVSDLHMDVNRQYNIYDALKTYVRKQKVDLLCIAGDVSSDMATTTKYLEALENQTGIIVKAVPGNHEMWVWGRGTSQQAHNLFKKQKFSLIDKPYQINENTILIGDMGWYDYSFGDNGLTKDAFDAMHYGGKVWKDARYCNWGGLASKDICAGMLKRLEKQLKKAGKFSNIIVMTHIVPFQDFVTVKEVMSWNYFNAFMGSAELGRLFKKYGVTVCNFGHTHFRYSTPYGNMYIICSPLGYQREWRNKLVLEEEIKNAVLLYDIF